VQAVQIRVFEEGYYPFRSETLPFVIDAKLDRDGDVYVSGLELHKVEPEYFANDDFQYFFYRDCHFFEVVS